MPGPGLECDGTEFLEERNEKRGKVERDLIPSPSIKFEKRGLGLSEWDG